MQKRNKHRMEIKIERNTFNKKIELIFIELKKH